MELLFFCAAVDKKVDGEPRSRMEDREGGNRRGEEGGEEDRPKFVSSPSENPLLLFFFLSLSLAFHLEPAESAVR